MSVPFLKNGHLVVNGQPFLMLAGEVHNSNSSSVEFMEGVWDKADTLGMNCLLTPITWELIEPVEDIFDFSLVDGLIDQARIRGKKLAFLWFGAWKNAQCHYAPSWVKQDTKRFLRAETVPGKPFTRVALFGNMPYSTLSYLCDNTCEADKKAFVALMEHLKQVDSEENTVVMIQVENESGLMNAAREKSPQADSLFAAPVPQEFVDYMRNHTDTMTPEVRAAVEAGHPSGSWEEVFGSFSEECFSAYHIATYIGKLAKAGKEVYPLPMNVNCWLDNGRIPGEYPTGGPVSKVQEIWHFCAPDIDVYSPDIYIPEFCEVCDEFTRRGGPLFIPECATHAYCGPRLVYTIGHYHAGCYAPFGFEDLGDDFDIQGGAMLGMDERDPLRGTRQNVAEYGWYSRTLQSMMPLLTANYGTNRLQAVCRERCDSAQLNFGNFGININLAHRFIKRQDGVCLVCQVAENEFYIIANGCSLEPVSLQDGKPYMDVLVLEEGQFRDNKWIPGRRFNGDEVCMMCYNTPTLLHLTLSSYC